MYALELYTLQHKHIRILDLVCYHLSCMYKGPVGTRRNNNVIIISKRRRDVVLR